MRFTRWATCVATLFACHKEPAPSIAVASNPTVTTAAVPSLASAVPSSPTTQTAAPDSRAPYIDAYFPGYEAGLLSVDRIDFALLTRLIVARVTPRKDGTLETSFDMQKGLAFAQKAARAAHDKGRKVILMIGGEGAHEGFLAASKDADHRRALVTALLDVVRAGPFDGVDLDWEPIEASDHAPLLALVDALKLAMPALELSVPVGWNQAVDPFYGELAKRVERINIMSYVMAGAWSGWSTWHSSALKGDTEKTPSSVARAVKIYLDSGVPKNKLGVGAGLYGMCWQGPQGPGEVVGTSKVVASDNVISFAEITRTYLPLTSKVPGAKALWDETARVPSLQYAKPSGPKGCTWISYEDERSLTEKANFIREQGLAGIIVWTLPQGYLSESGTHPLLQTLHKALR
jgi:chitinase